MAPSAFALAKRIYEAATPVLVVHTLTEPRWKRNIANNPRDARIGPWLQAKYSIVNDAAWCSRDACLYLVGTADGHIRYVGISRNGVKHRWRTSPAYNAATMARLPQDQLFHSQCWRHMEAMAQRSPGMSVEVRSIHYQALAQTLARLGPPLSALLILGDDGEGLCAAMERWLCNRSDGEFLNWNTAMTRRVSNAASC